MRIEAMPEEGEEEEETVWCVFSKEPKLTVALLDYDRAEGESRAERSETTR